MQLSFEHAQEVPRSEWSPLGRVLCSPADLLAVSIALVVDLVMWIILDHIVHPIVLDLSYRHKGSGSAYKINQEHQWVD